MIGGRVTVDMVHWLRQRCHGSRLTWPPRAEQLRAEEEAALRRHCVPYERLDLCLRGVGPACGGRAAKAEPAADAGPAAPRGAALIQERLNSATRPTCMSLKVLCRSAASRTTRSYAPTADGRALGRLPLREHARLAALLPGACWHAVGGSQDRRHEVDDPQSPARRQRQPGLAMRLSRRLPRRPRPASRHDRPHPPQAHAWGLRRMVRERGPTVSWAPGWTVARADGSSGPSSPDGTPSSPGTLSSPGTPS